MTNIRMFFVSAREAVVTRFSTPWLHVKLRRKIEVSHSNFRIGAADAKFVGSWKVHCITWKKNKLEIFKLKKLDWCGFFFSDPPPPPNKTGQKLPRSNYCFPVSFKLCTVLWYFLSCSLIGRHSMPKIDAKILMAPSRTNDEPLKLFLFEEKQLSGLTFVKCKHEIKKGRLESAWRMMVLPWRNSPSRIGFSQWTTLQDLNQWNINGIDHWNLQELNPWIITGNKLLKYEC